MPNGNWCSAPVRDEVKFDRKGAFTADDGGAQQSRKMFTTVGRSLRGTAGGEWESILADNGENYRVVHFKASLKALIHTMLGSDVAYDQRDYLDQAPMPRQMDVWAWVRHRRLMNATLGTLGGTPLS